MVKKILTTKSARNIVLAYSKRYEGGMVTMRLLKTWPARSIRKQAEQILACTLDEDIQSLAERFDYRF